MKIRSIYSIALVLLIAAPIFGAKGSPVGSGVMLQSIEETANRAVYRLSVSRSGLERLPLEPGPGDRGLPVHVFALELPYGVSAVAVDVTVSRRATVRGELPLAQEPLVDCPTGDFCGAPRSSAERKQAPEAVLLDEFGRIGARPFARFKVYPLVASDEAGKVELRSEIELVLTFERDDAGTAVTSVGAAPVAIDDLAARTLRPYGGAIESPSPGPASAAPRSLAGLTAPRIRIEVDAQGIYRILGSDLAAAGLVLAEVDPATLAMSSGGAPVALHLIGGAGATLAPTDEILFYGQPMTTRFTRSNVYWLEWGGSPGPLMQQRDAAPSGGGSVPTTYPWTAHLEQEQYYTQAPPQTALDHWWWDRLDNPAPALQPPPGGSPLTSVTYDIDLPGLSGAAHSIDLRVSLQGRYDDDGNNPDHHTRIELDSNLVDDQTWDGFGSVMHDVTLSSSLFSEIGNGVTVDLPGDTGANGDSLYTNFVEADYDRTYTAESDILEFLGSGPGTLEYRVAGFSGTDLEVLDITDPVLPAHLTGFSSTGVGPYTINIEDSPAGTARYFAVERGQLLSPSGLTLSQSVDLLDAANGADHLIIAPPEFAAALEPLRAHHEAGGMRAEIVTTLDIYNLFNDGVSSPQAIVDFLSYAYTGWIAPAPTYVVLAGDGSVDYLNHMGYGPNSFVPTLLSEVEDFGETPCDNCYAMVSGADLIPDMYVGRLPVSTVAEATDLVAKLIAHDTSPPYAALNAQALFVADDDSPGFPATLNALIAGFLPAQIPAETVYLGGASDGSAERTAIMNAIDTGSLLAIYLGLGGVEAWAAEQILSTADVPLLANGNRLPFVTAVYNFSGYHSHGELVALVEALVRAGDRGAAAGWATGAFTGTAEYGAILAELMDNLLADFQPAMGVAAIDALVEAVNSGGATPQNIQHLLFMGDPAISFAVTPDLDEDGVDNGVDCAPTDDQTWGIPTEVSDLLIDVGVQIGWSPGTGGSVVYDVVRGSLDDLRADGLITQATCMLSGASTPATTDPLAPLAGGSYYLVRARNPCAADGDYGSSSALVPRTSSVCP